MAIIEPDPFRRPIDPSEPLKQLYPIGDQPLTAEKLDQLLPLDDLRRRIGAFSIDMDHFDSDLAFVAAILDGCIVIRAESIYYKRSIEYVALHPQFDLVEAGCDAPSYERQYRHQPHYRAHYVHGVMGDWVKV